VIAAADRPAAAKAQIKMTDLLRHYVRVYG